MSKADRSTNLIIFDLDGTLINVFEFHTACLEKVVRRIWNVPNDLPKHKRYGIPQIGAIRRICEIGGVAEKEINLHLPQAMEMLTTEMGQSLPPDLRGRLLQGSKELLTLMSTKEDVCLTLATGTLGATAEIILERCGLDAYFPVGAFGHECYSRQELIQLAKKRAIEYFALDPMLTLVVTIGDAPSDIEAGKAIGARTVSVASSSFSMEELSRFKPDVQLESFTDVEKAFISILGDGYPFTRAENVDSKE